MKVDYMKREIKERREKGIDIFFVEVLNDMEQMETNENLGR